MTKELFDLLVVGAGPAGMMAAIRAAERGKKVLILEKGPSAGRKLLLCGNRRCNLTNAETDLNDFAANYLKNPSFMLSMLHNYSNFDVIEFFEKRGVKLKVEPWKRVFPKSNKSSDILNVLLRELENLNVDIKYNCKVVFLINDGKKVLGVKTEIGDFWGKAVLVATGGKTHQKTGSSGDGYILAEAIGHKIVPPKKALYPFEIENSSICEELSGLSVKAEVSFVNNSGLLYKETGDILFAHFGLTGPLMINASLIVSKAQMSGLKIKVNFFPEKKDVEVDNDLQELIRNNPNKTAIGLLDMILPKKLALIILSLSQIDKDKKVNQLTREQRFLIAQNLTSLEFKVSKYVNVNKSVATDGGIDLKEINNKTLESKLIKGLYFAGEVLDIIGKTGGFNLQAAWSTGWTVGNMI